MPSRTIPTENELAGLLNGEIFKLGPLSVRWESKVKGNDIGYDGIICIKWEKKAFRFGIEYKRLFNPKSLRQAIERVKQIGPRDGLRPLVVLPYLSRSALDALESEGISGIDLCGNGIVIIPDEIYMRRDGQSNQFRSEDTIKNVYRFASSVVARVFLSRPEFPSTQAVLREITTRGGHVTLPTVSKVCKSLENELIVERCKNGVMKLRLIQPDKLLDRLSENYTPPKIRRRISGKFVGDTQAFSLAAKEWADRDNGIVVRTGATSVSAYAVMAREGLEEFYCSNIDAFLRSLGNRFDETSRFATVSLLETNDETAFFDRQANLAASPVQVFLELSDGDKRDRETAADVRKLILNRISAALPG